MNSQGRFAEAFVILLIIIALFAGWITSLDLELVHIWAIAATIGLLLSVAVVWFIMKRR